MCSLQVALVDFFFFLQDSALSFRGNLSRQKRCAGQSEKGQTSPGRGRESGQTVFPETLPHPLQYDIICLVRGAAGRLHTKRSL